MTRLAFLAVWLSVGAASAAARDMKVLPPDIDGVAPRSMMHAYLMRAVPEALDRRDAEFEKLKTPGQLAAYQQQMRELFVGALGGFPARTPLNPLASLSEVIANASLKQVYAPAAPARGRRSTIRRRAEQRSSMD